MEPQSGLQEGHTGWSNGCTGWFTGMMHRLVYRTDTQAGLQSGHKGWSTVACCYLDMVACSSREEIERAETHI